MSTKKLTKKHAKTCEYPKCERPAEKLEDGRIVERCFWANREKKQGGYEKRYCSGRCRLAHFKQRQTEEFERIKKENQELRQRLSKYESGFLTQSNIEAA